MSVRRLRTAACLITFVMLVCMARLAWIDLLPSRHASGSPAGGQRRPAGPLQLHSQSLRLDSGRGDFRDRSGLPLTGFSYRSLALFPLPSSASRGTGRDLSVLARIMGIGREELTKKLSALKSPEFWQDAGSGIPRRLSAAQERELAGLRIEGVAVLPFRARYPEGESGIQAIGYVSENPDRIRELYAKQLQKGKAALSDVTGGAGLELSLDKVLRGTGPSYARYFTDGGGAPLKGLDMTLTRPSTPLYPLQAVTTISLPLQRELERMARLEGLAKGAVVVLDVRNADIVAMVSMPSFDPLKLDGSLSGTENHGVKAFTPGSIFKLVTEAAALEAGVTSEGERFFCPGQYGRYGLSCWKEGGHGLVTLRQGLAQSCNIVFAGLAERLTPSQIRITADRLGLGKRVGWSLEDGEAAGPLKGPLRLLWEEESGQVFRQGGTPGERSGGELARTGIGQQDVLASPFQAANLMVTLLHGGQVLEPRLLREIRYADGQLLARMPAHELESPYGRITPATAAALRKGMEAVVSGGTGRSLQRRSWQLAGKSGTAETGRPGQGNHQWFAGYGPVRSPRYAVAVLAENRPEGSPNQAARLFGSVMDALAAWEASGAERLP